MAMSWVNCRLLSVTYRIPFVPSDVIPAGTPILRDRKRGRPQVRHVGDGPTACCRARLESVERGLRPTGPDRDDQDALAPVGLDLAAKAARLAQRCRAADVAGVGRDDHQEILARRGNRPDGRHWRGRRWAGRRWSRWGGGGARGRAGCGGARGRAGCSGARRRTRRQAEGRWGRRRGRGRRATPGREQHSPKEDGGESHRQLS